MKKMKKIIAKILVITMLISIMTTFTHFTGAAATINNVPYINENGQSVRANNVTVLTGSYFADGVPRTLTAGWYLVRGGTQNIPIRSGQIIIQGIVHLILENNSYLFVSGGAGNAGIRTTDATLHIYAQSTNPDIRGELSAGGDGGAGIGGNNGGDGGTITINGGSVSARGVGIGNGAGIGGGQNGSGGTITINGGYVDTGSNGGGAGIGGGINGAGGTVNINGGRVIAGSGSGAGIGAGAGSSNQGTLTLNGNGVVSAKSVPTLEPYPNGILFNNNTGTGTVYGSVTLQQNFIISSPSQTLTIPNGASLTIPSGVTLGIDNEVINEGTITNNGLINIAVGTLTNKGILINNNGIGGNGNLINETNGTITNNSDISIFGTFENKAAKDKIINDGKIVTNNGINLPCRHNDRTSEDCRVCEVPGCDHPPGTIFNRTCTSANPCPAHPPDVPPTGISDMTGPMWLMFTFIAISAGLWGYLLFNRSRKKNT